MDPLTDLLNGLRTSGAVFDQSLLSGSWALRFDDGSPMALIVPLRGQAWVLPDDADPVRLEPDDVAVLCGGRPYVVANDPATKPTMVIHPGGRCTTVRGEEFTVSSVTGVGPWGGQRPDSALLLSGRYTVDSGAPDRLLAALPPLAVVQAKLGICPVSPAVLDEITREEPGKQALQDRMLDFLLITALRAWFTRPGAQVPDWFRAYSDPVVGPALRLLHTNPAHPWTVATLAARTGVSRASLARRFTSVVGQPPMTYLRDWRLTLAADWLCEPGATIGAVAGRVGFTSAFALSIAFKRERGVSPSEYRTKTPQR